MADSTLTDEIVSSLDEKNKGYTLYISPEGHLLIGMGEHGRRLQNRVLALLDPSDEDHECGSDTCPPPCGSGGGGGDGLPV